MKLLKPVLLILLSLVTLIGFAVGGWYFGFRDGASCAYADMSSALVDYHLASTRHEPAVAHRVIDRYTGEVVSHLLNGRHRFPPIGIFPYRSTYKLSLLRASWTPLSDVVLAPTVHYPYTPKFRDYRAEFDAVTPASKVDGFHRYEE